MENEKKIEIIHPEEVHAYQKDFDSWNTEKKIIDNKEIKKERYFHEGEVWWASLGLNIGYEQDGKNEKFERPVLIIKKFNNNLVWVVPLTKQDKINKFHYRLEQSQSVAILSQIRTTSTKRMFRYVEKINNREMREIVSRTKEFFPIFE